MEDKTYNFDNYQFKGEIKNERLDEDFFEVELDDYTLFVSKETFKPNGFKPFKDCDGYKAVISVCDWRGIENLNQIDVTINLIHFTNDFDFAEDYGGKADIINFAIEEVECKGEDDEQKFRTEIDGVMDLVHIASHIAHHNMVMRWAEMIYDTDKICYD